MAGKEEKAIEYTSTTFNKLYHILFRFSREKGTYQQKGW